MKLTLDHYVNAGFPAVCIQTADEDRAIASILTYASTHGRQVLKIAAVGGLTRAHDNSAVNPQAGFAQAFEFAADTKNTGKVITVVCDYQHELAREAVTRNARAYRLIREFLPRIKRAENILIFLAPNWNLPAEIEHDMPVQVDLLPTRTELSVALEQCLHATGEKITEDRRNALLDAACGLTLAEAESAFSLSYAASSNDDNFSPAIVAEMKMKLVRQSGLAEIVAPAKLSEIGGYRGFTDCITGEVIPAMSHADIAVSGIISDGVQGTGKSLGARILSGMLQWPIMRVDMASLKASSGGIVGQSEAGLLKVFKLARAIAPVILFFDEAEKGFRGSSNANDSGVSSGMLGIFLTQTQEIRDAQEKVFLYFTTNDYRALPPPVMRRLEVKFFFDLPSRSERVEIAKVKLAQFAKGNLDYAGLIADVTDQWTGSEIEDLVRSATRLALKSGSRNFDETIVKRAQKDIKPIALTNAEETDRLRSWGKANLRLANSVDVEAAAVPPRGNRKIEKLSRAGADVANSISQGEA